MSTDLPFFNEIMEGIRDRIAETIQLQGLHVEMRYSPTVSNTHSCPRNGVENFMRHADKPTSYPGLIGRTWIRTSGQRGREFNNAYDELEKQRLFQGTGGVGSYNGPWSLINFVSHQVRNNNTLYYTLDLKSFKDHIICPDIYSWDSKMFFDDFPGLQEAVETQISFNILSNAPAQIVELKWGWDDEHTLEEDARLISLYQSHPKTKFDKKFN